MDISERQREERRENKIYEEIKKQKENEETLKCDTSELFVLLDAIKRGSLTFFMAKGHTRVCVLQWKNSVKWCACLSYCEFL
jgi:hypothetical protein